MQDYFNKKSNFPHLELIDLHDNSNLYTADSV